MDYLFDWARDVYREAIISELRSLAADNTTSLGNDIDVFSLEDRVAFWPQLPRVQEESDDEVETSTKPNMTVGAITQDPLKALILPTEFFVTQDISGPASWPFISPKTICLF